MIIKAATLPKFIHNWRVCWFLTKHPSRQTEQLQAIVFIVLLYDLKRSKDKDFTKTRDLKELHLRAKWLPRKLNLIHENNDNECVCLFTFFHFSRCLNLTSINSCRRRIFLSSTAHSLQPTSWTICFVLHF